ncbi:MAG: T9SS type A sorting domain-containing protein [Bacteroidales bacterium]|nr:T9SS type A sorting domain-containing protein [Bacteroidales bacterium]
MKKTLFLMLALLLVASGFAQKGPQTKLISSSEERIVVEVQLNGYNTTRVQTPQGEQLIISAPGMYAMLEAGAPDLPMFPIPAIIGDRAEMTVNVINADYTDYTNVSIAPSKGNFSRQINPNDVAYTYGAMYQQDAFYPATQAYLEAPYIYRDFRGQNIMVRPFAYNPVTKTLRVYDHLTIEMAKVSDNGLNQKASRKSNTMKVDPEFKASYDRHFINFGATEAKYTFVSDAGSMLVVAADQYADAMQPLVAWKNMSGRPCTLVTISEIGSNNDTQIKNYIQNLYENDNLEFILLVGDLSDVTSHSMSNGRSDNWYGMLEGTDNYCEAFVGRFSCNNITDAETQVNKVLYYERDMPAGLTWLNKGLGVGANEGAGNGHMGGEADYVHVDYIRDTLLHYTYEAVSQQYSGVGGGTSANAISADLNAGVSIVNYCNHGSQTSWAVANYSNSNVNALTNDYMWPYVISVACNNGQFDGTCFGEAWLRATNNATGAPTGALGGMFSWISQPWTPPMTGQDEMIAIFTEWRNLDQFHHTIGGMAENGNMKILDAHPSDNGSTHNTWINFADPSTMMRSDNPVEMEVSMNPSALMIGMDACTISTDANFGIVTLSNEEGEVIASDYLVDGEVELHFNALSTVGTYNLVIMGYNKVTYISPIEVLPSEGAFVSVAEFTPDAAPVNQEVSMSMSFTNVGADPTVGTTTISISCEDPLLQIVNGNAEFGVLAAGESITLENAFSFMLDPSVSDGDKFQIDVTMTCGDAVWIGKAKITAAKAVLSYEGTNWAGSFTPGEDVTLRSSFKNVGHYTASNAYAVIHAESEYITMVTDSVYVGTLDPEGLSNCHFTIHIDENCPATESLTIVVNMYADDVTGTENEVVLRNSCNVVFDLVDSYGDGWNGNKLTVSFDDGTPTQQLTIESGNTASYTHEIGSGVHVTLGWINGSWTTECSFTVHYEDGTQITSANNLSASWSYEFDCNCGGSSVVVTYDPIQNLSYEVSDHLFTLTWDPVSEKGFEYYSVTRNGVEVAQLTEPVYTEELADESIVTFCVSAVYNDGESDAECLTTEENILAVEEASGKVSVYPNPVNSTLFINGNTEYSYVLYNGMGQEMASGNGRGAQSINVSEMPKGIYFLRLTTGTQVNTQKVVVE